MPHVETIMRLRRCALLWLEAREVATFDLGGVLAGGTGVRAHMQWLAHAPHLPAPVEVDADAVGPLGETSPHEWVEAAALQRRHGVAVVQGLLDAGLLLGDEAGQDANRKQDERARGDYWHPAAALAHMSSRWEGEDAVKELREAGLGTARAVRAHREPPPPAFRLRGDGGEVVALARAAPAAFDDLLDARSTCRNFDQGVALPFADFARVLERSLAARGVVQAADGLELAKKTSPSGGALHPTEAYVLVQRVEGVRPGLYHYRAGEHALQALPWKGGGDHGDDAEALASLARLAVAGQYWFANAHAMVVLAPRFARNFWKYRHHAKAYRVCVLDVGHLSQTLLLCATEQGLGAFVTAAINEVDIERAFGLDGLAEGPLVVCGFGPRAAAMDTPEFDPGHKAWRD
jgi:putative peptide maturation dehydrogenase